ncbi:MAG: 4-(cytidine 5'-diphospho)-2-C-methyl-D-erythritol kinase [Acidimicrobiia bacterium]
MMRALAYAKINLALAVFPAAADGMHPIRGIFQSIALADTVDISMAREDSVTVSNDEAPDDTSNLAWVAFDAARRSARVGQTAAITITKRIPAGAGLGGGSADAAAALGLTAERFGIDDDTVHDIAQSIGSDVPFALSGGTSLVEGRGERLTPMKPLDEFALAVVVPPFLLATADVYQRWDALGSPEGKAILDSDLPPSLRGGLPVRNDLYPAAVSLDPRVGDWRGELESLWGTAVAMTGSGSALFSFFGSLDEADGAASAVTMPTRLSTGVDLSLTGWDAIDG